MYLCPVWNLISNALYRSQTVFKLVSVVSFPWNIQWCVISKAMDISLLHGSPDSSVTLLTSLVSKPSKWLHLPTRVQSLESATQVSDLLYQNDSSPHRSPSFPTVAATNGSHRTSWTSPMPSMPSQLRNLLMALGILPLNPLAVPGWGLIH